MTTPFPTHPLYQENLQDWQLLEDCFAGERRVKSKGITYLPATPGQVLDGLGVNACGERKPGQVAYDNYKMRAVFPDFFTEGVKTLVGILNEKPAKVTVPEAMQYVVDRITQDREGIAILLRQIHFECLTTGRGGLLVDLPKRDNTDQLSDPEPYIAMYGATTIVNWDDGRFNGGLDRLNLVALDESGWERTADFQWVQKQKNRVLSLGPVDPEAANGGTYVQFVSEDGATQDLEEILPILRGETLQEIPFTFFGPVDLNSTPDQPPLIGLARLCMHIYRSEADYRYTLFMQGQETLVTIGGLTNSGELSEGSNNQALRVGADARIDLQINGDAKYIGVSSNGLPEQRMALDADRQLAAVRTGQLLAPGKMSMESGEALKTRVAAQTATLTSVAMSSAAALQAALRNIAKWKGLDPEDVTVEPNLEFSNYQIATQDLVQLITAKRLGFPMSFESLHRVAKDRGLTDATFAEEMLQIEKDPKVLTAIMALDAGDSGNNPQQTAGGPPKSTAGKAPVSNEQKK